MNVAFFLTPKNNVAFLYDDFSIRQALEKMHHHGYSSIPVISRDGLYVSTISEGDFLWYLVDGEGGEVCKTDIRDVEFLPISGLLQADRNPPIRITDNIDQLLQRAMKQNFVPVVDDRGAFIGIVTRQDIIRYFLDKLPETQPTKSPLWE